MPKPFLSSEEYDERAHQLYNEGEYDQALAVLKEGLSLYPNSVELHIGVGYALHAQEEYAWARRAFEEALVLDPEHEDALAGFGETVLKFGQRDVALRAFEQTLDLGYNDDLDLMLQIGRALFRDEMVEEAKRFFEIAVQLAPESAETVSCLGYVEHRLGNTAQAVLLLSRALGFDPEYAEARIYLGNILYDQADYEGALSHLEHSRPDDHWDELGIWRLIELKKSVYKLQDGDPELKPWEDRIQELVGETSDIDEMLAEIETAFVEREEQRSRGQLEVFGALLTTLADVTGTELGAERTSPEAGTSVDVEHDVEGDLRGHRIVTNSGTYEGTWDEIVQQLRDRHDTSVTIEQYMAREARLGYGKTGVEISANDAESFIRGSANAGLLRIDK